MFEHPLRWDPFPMCVLHCHAWVEVLRPGCSRVMGPDQMRRLPHGQMLPLMCLADTSDR